MTENQTGPATGVTPHLTVSDGHAAAAFYIAAFGAVEHYRQLAEDGKRLFHCYMGLNNGAIMLNDDFPEYRGGVPARPPASVTIHLQVDDADEIWARALAAGARVDEPLADQPWGLRYGVLKDPFGHSWSIASRL